MDGMRLKHIPSFHSVVTRSKSSLDGNRIVAQNQKP